MFYHVKELQFNARVSRPDPVFATLLPEQFGGANGEFRADLQEAQRQGITRSPSLIIKNAQNQAVLFSGYRPYSALLTLLQQVVSLEKTNPLPTPEQYKACRPFLTAREMSECTGSAL